MFLTFLLHCPLFLYYPTCKEIAAASAMQVVEHLKKIDSGYLEYSFTDSLGVETSCKMHHESSIFSLASSVAQAHNV